MAKNSRYLLNLNKREQKTSWDTVVGNRNPVWRVLKIKGVKKQADQIRVEQMRKGGCGA